jgi:hypothetical protein
MIHGKLMESVCKTVRLMEHWIGELVKLWVSTNRLAE